jgi:hypothetical protein
LFALANFLDLAMADGHLSDAEETLLHYFIEQSSIPEQQIDSLLAVLAIKNNSSVFE